MVEFFSQEMELRVWRYLTMTMTMMIGDMILMTSPELHGRVVTGNVVTGCSQSHTSRLLPLGSNHLVIIIINDIIDSVIISDIIIIIISDIMNSIIISDIIIIISDITNSIIISDIIIIISNIMIIISDIIINDIIICDIIINDIIILVT